MNFEQYSPLALRTCKPLEGQLQMEHAQIGMVTEIGELADNFKRHFIYGKELDIVNIVEEAGDMLWYFALYCNENMIHPRHIDQWIAQSLEDDLGSNLKAVLLLAGMVGAMAATPSIETSAIEIAEPFVNTLTILLGRYKFTMSDAMVKNITKLSLRYGDKYSDYAALNRDLEQERSSLEA